MKSVFFITPELKRLDRLGTGMLALFRFKEMRPLTGISSLVDWRLRGHLSRLIIDGFLAGEAGESLLMPLGGLLYQEFLLVMGLGPRAGFGGDVFDEVIKKLFDAARGVCQFEIALALPGRVEGECESVFALERFLELWQKHGSGLAVRIIEPLEAQKVMQPVLERWRLKQLVPPDVRLSHPE